MSLDFCRMILSGEKRLVKKADLIPVFTCERFPELTITNLLTFGRERIPDLDAYLPSDNAADIERCKLLNDRGYILSVVNTLAPHSIEELREQAINRAKGIDPGNQDDRRIRLLPEFEAIFTDPTFPLGIDLLKDSWKSKVAVETRRTPSTPKLTLISPKRKNTSQ